MVAGELAGEQQPGDRAELHILVPHATAAHHVLAISQVAVTREREVAVVEVDDRPGILAELAGKIAAAGINLDLVYVATRNRVVFGAADLPGLDPAAILQQSSRFLDTAASIGRSAVDLLPDSWEGAPADAAIEHGRQAHTSAVALSERGDRIGELTRAATATVERGNVELTGIAQSFLAVASATALTGRFSCSSAVTQMRALFGSSAPRQRRGRNGLIGVSASSGALMGRIGPWAERL